MVALLKFGDAVFTEPLDASDDYAGERVWSWSAVLRQRHASALASPIAAMVDLP